MCGFPFITVNQTERKKDGAYFKNNVRNSSVSEFHIDEKQIRERTGHKSNALQRYERTCEQQVFQVGKGHRVPNKIKSLMDNIDAQNSSETAKVDKTNLLCDLNKFECDVFDDVNVWLGLVRA